MPHLDALTIHAMTFARDSQSRLRAPRGGDHARSRPLGWLRRAMARARRAPRIKRQDLEVRALEGSDSAARAGHRRRSPRIERDFEARDAGAWNWR